MPDAVKDGGDYIVQEYIGNPLLMEGKKFDLRLYVGMFGVEPMSTFIYDEGLVRLCTEDYEKPTKENRKNAYMHLTNYSLNKQSEEFSKDLIGGSKRTYSTFLSYLEEMDPEIMEEAKRSIENVIAQTMNALHPFISNYCEGYIEGDIDKKLKANLF